MTLDALSSCSVLLLDARYGQCRAIVGYVSGYSTSAVVCGLPVSPPRVAEDGATLAYSWCPQHKAAYLHNPANAVHIPAYCRR